MITVGKITACSDTVSMFLPPLQIILLTFASMVRHFGLIAFTVFLACSNEQKPEQLIEKDKFVDVLTDVRIMEAAYGVTFSQKDSVKVSMSALYDSLFYSRGITETNFLSSYRYYSRSPEELTSIEEMVMEKLTNLHLELEQKQFKNQSADSLAVNDTTISQ